MGLTLAPSLAAQTTPTTSPAGTASTCPSATTNSTATTSPATADAAQNTTASCPTGTTTGSTTTYAGNPFDDATGPTGGQAEGEGSPFVGAPVVVLAIGLLAAVIAARRRT